MLCTKLRMRGCRGRRGNHRDVDKIVWSSRKNIVVTGVPDKGRRYMSDFYTTLIDIQWRWNLLFFVVGFVFTWLVFAIYYFLLCFLHGDIDPEHRSENSTWKPCVMNVNSFTEAYLFSIETMSTIGYGVRYQTEECPGIYLAVMLQSVIGAGLQFALASLVVSKTRRANRVSQTILFSNTAVVYQEDGKFKLAVRIGDMRKGDVIGAHATGMLIRKIRGKEGHRVPVRMFSVPFDAESGRQKLFLCWPSVLVHIVDQHSPLWPLTPEDLQKDMYELIVVLNGVSATTGKPFQARKSYHSWEILWGRRFKPLHISDDNLGFRSYVVNYGSFHESLPVTIPMCSAQMLERKRLLLELGVEDEEELLAEDFFDDHVELLYTEEDTLDLCRGARLGVEYNSEDEELDSCHGDDIRQSSEAGILTTDRPVRIPTDVSAEASSVGDVAAISSTSTPSRRVSVVEVGGRRRKSSVMRRESRVEKEERQNKVEEEGEDERRGEAGKAEDELKEYQDDQEEQSAKFWATRKLRRPSPKKNLSSSETLETTLGSRSGTPTSNPSPPTRPSRDHRESREHRESRDYQRVRKTSRVEFQSLQAVIKAGVASLPLSGPQRRLSREDALNMYRHRRSVTDTYLGTELPEEESDLEGPAGAAIWSMLAQQNRGGGGLGVGGGFGSGGVGGDGRLDVREGYYRVHRKSTTQELLFAPEGSEDGELFGL